MNKNVWRRRNYGHKRERQTNNDNKDKRLMTAHNANVEALVRCYKRYWVRKRNGKLLMKFREYFVRRPQEDQRRTANGAAKRELG